MVALIQDIDESKKYQEKLESKNKELDTLFYKISHDLKSPITTLKGLAQILKMENKGIQNVETYRHLEEAIIKLEKQNNSLLQLTKVFEHKVNEGDFMLSHLIGFIIDEGLAVFHKKNLDVTISSDPFLVGVIIGNIVENARIFKSADRDLEIIIQYRVLPGQQIITIEDNGAGISEESLEKIFEMFYRADYQLSGPGLGLYIAKIAAERIRATVQVKSELGKGTIFEVLIPRLV
jgi:signal transduction histidine kinase